MDTEQEEEGLTYYRVSNIIERPAACQATSMLVGPQEHTGRKIGAQKREMDYVIWWGKIDSLRSPCREPKI